MHMWLAIWTVVIAADIGLVVFAMAVLPKDQRATFGK
jgi:hypothetical protein